MLTLVCMLAVLGISAMVAAAALLSRHWHIRFTGDIAGPAGHKHHAGHVPRIGGLAVFLGALFGIALLTPDMFRQAAAEIWMLWGCLSLAFAGGFLEDLTRSVPAVVRYVACLAAALLVSLAYGALGITSVAIPLIDPLLGSSLAAGVMLFVFAVASLSHAFNLIDGENGLCAGYSIIIFVVLAYVAGNAAEVALAELCLVMAMANAGFLVFNFPAGKLFLGDGGAYFNGAVIAVTTVIVVERASDVSPMFALLLLIYPVWETLFSMLRRLLAGRAFYLPDRDHLHHRLRAALQRNGLYLTGLPTLIVLTLVTPFAMVALHGPGDIGLLVFGCVAFAGVYSLLYRALGVQATASQADAVSGQLRQPESSEGPL